MKSRAVPVTAFRGGEGLLPGYQRLVKNVVIPYQYEILNDRIEGVEKSHAMENFRLAAKKTAGRTRDGRVLRHGVPGQRRG